MAPTFPGAVPTTTQLRGDIGDNVATFLSAGIDAVVTTIPVDDTTDFPSAGLASIKKVSGSGLIEVFSYTGKTANSFTGVARDFNGKGSQTYAENDEVHLYWVADHHNRFVEEVIAISQNIVNRFGLNLNIVIPSAVTMSRDGGKITNLGAATGAGDALRYEQLVGVYLALAGGVMAGAIAMGGNKITGLGAAAGAGDALRYEQLIGQYLLLTGGTLSGPLAMGANKITGLSAASSPGDAVRYEEFILAGSGKILQVVKAVSTAIFTTTSGVFVNTNLTATITPSSSSSKILVIAVSSGNSNDTTGGNFYGLTRDGNNITAGTIGQAHILNSGISSGSTSVPITLMTLDSPGSTAPITYRVVCKSNGIATTAYGRTNGHQEIVLMEVAG